MDERPELPREVHRDLRGAARPGDIDDLARAFAGAGAALEEDDVPRAVELLRWAKNRAPRSGVLREALGVALYLAGDLAGARSELLAYRRLTGRADQNHLLADCARADAREDLATQYVEEMEAQGVDEERVVEGRIVLAGLRADRGDVRGGLALLERIEVDPHVLRPWYARLWYAAADLAERVGDRDAARDWFEAILAVEDDFLDVVERLAALDR